MNSKAFKENLLETFTEGCAFLATNGYTGSVNFAINTEPRNVIRITIAGLGAGEGIIVSGQDFGACLVEFIHRFEFAKSQISINQWLTSAEDDSDVGDH